MVVPGSAITRYGKVLPVNIDVIAHIHTDFPQKFGVPRQSGLVPELEARIVFESAYALPDAVRGIEGFSHIWLIWGFEDTEREGGWSPTVRPPRLGGRKRMGVFATRSPFRPNPLGLSSVELAGVEYVDGAPVLHVRGADLRDGTPIYDIKPYLAYTDSHADACGGFADDVLRDQESCPMAVAFPENLLNMVPSEKREALLAVLRQDPRPAFSRDASRAYSMAFGQLDVSFVVDDGAHMLEVVGVRPR